MNEPTYQTLKVTFTVPIQTFNNMFGDTHNWGVATLKEWVDSYESTRFTEIDEYTAIITSEYNMEHVKKWLEKYTSIYAQIEL